MFEPVLSDGQLLTIYDEAGECHKRSEFVALFKVVEQAVLAKLAEKQEPVAYQNKDDPSEIVEAATKDNQ